MIPHTVKHHIAIGWVTLATALGAPTPSTTPASVTLNFPATDVRNILSLYESLTHFRIIRDNFVQGKVMISVAEPLPPEKAIEIIERTLFTNGFSIIQVDANTVEINGPGKNPRANGVPTFSNASELPTQERLVSFLFKFRYTDCAKMRELFKQHLLPVKMYTSFFCADDANALWVTERTSVIRQLLVAAEKLDVPPARRSHAEP
jgi:type II secretory pathway component GspD/PulD (secretin)